MGTKAQRKVHGGLCDRLVDTSHVGIRGLVNLSLYLCSSLM